MPDAMTATVTVTVRYSWYFWPMYWIAKRIARRTPLWLLKPWLRATYYGMRYYIGERRIGRGLGDSRLACQVDDGTEHDSEED